MTTYTDANASAARFFSSYGNAYRDDGSVATPATLTTTDKVRLIQVPAGVRVQDLTIRNTDLDSGSTIVHKVGYEAVNADSSLSAVTDYFGSSQTHLRTAGRTEYDFDPITFNEPVWITLTPTAGPATTAGTIKTVVSGVCVGVK